MHLLVGKFKKCYNLCVNIKIKWGVYVKRKNKRSEITSLTSLLYTFLILSVFFVLIDHVEPLQKIWELLDFCFKIPLAVIYLGFFGIIVLPIWAVFFD